MSLSLGNYVNCLLIIGLTNNFNNNSDLRRYPCATSYSISVNCLGKPIKN